MDDDPPISIVIPLHELRVGDMISRRAGDIDVLVLRLEEGVFAVEDRCAHQRVRLSEGTLRGHVLVCSAHHYEYDARTGKGISPPAACVRSFPARIEGEEVIVEVTLRARRQRSAIGARDGD